MKSSENHLLEKLARNVLYHLDYSLRVDDMISESRLENILAESIDESDLEGLERMASEARADLEKLKTDASELGYDNSVAYMDSLIDEIPATPDLVSVTVENDPEKTAEEVGKIITLTKKANAFRDSFVQAVSLFGGNLAKVDVSDDAKEMMLQNIAEEDAELARGFPELDKLRTGAESAFVPPPEEKTGIFSKIASYLGFTDEFTKQKFAEDVLNSKYQDLVTKAAEMKADVPEAAADESETEAVTDELTDELESLATGDDSVLDMPEESTSGKVSDEQIDAEVESLVDDLGTGPISKSELTALLKKYPNISGKGAGATRHRRIFRKAINKIAGKQVFEESKDYDSPGKKYDVEDMAVYRMNKLAGLD